MIEAGFPIASRGRLGIGDSRGSRGTRQGLAVRRTVTDYVRSVCDLAQLVPGKSKAARQKAISTYATLVGAMILARAVDDRALSQEIRDAGLASSKT